MTNGLIDNSDEKNLLKSIKDILKNPIEEILIATGYWDIPGLSLLADELAVFLDKPNTSLKILIGSDPLFLAQYNAKPKYKGLQFPEEYIKTDIHEIEVKPEYENAVSVLLKYLNSKNKIEIRLYKKNEKTSTQFLHAKAYIFIGDRYSFGIIGSSNFTKKGLIGNAELNYLETNGSIITAIPTHGSQEKGHAYWFNEVWQNSIDWTHEFLEQVLLPSAIAQKVQQQQKQEMPTYTILSPYETYIKLLIEQFGDIINFDGKIKPDDYMPHDSSFRRLTYQTEAVNHGFQIMKQHGGFILADVVGLGKTFTALMVVKRYLLEINFTKKMLIITPPAVKQNWIESIEYFDKDVQNKIQESILITTIGTLDIENEKFTIEDGFDSSFQYADYGMIVVDESHRFRNTGTLMYQKLDALIGSIVPHPYVILLSATPQNNQPYDLRNQIYLFQREHNNSTLHNLGEFGNKLESYFADKQKRYESYIKKTKKIHGITAPKTQVELDNDRKNLIEDSEDIRKRIVEPLIIRRTRTDIKKFYKEDMQTQGLTFPVIQKPIAIPYEMNDELGKLFNETIDIIATQVNHIDTDENGNPIFDFAATPGISGLGYFRYQAIAFLKNEKHKKYYEKNNLTVDTTSQQLAKIMEILLIKRLESSQAAFKESLHNLQRYSENMQKMWEANRIFICPDVDVNKELSDESIQKNGSFAQCLSVIAEKAKKANKRNSGDEHNGPNQEYTQKDFASEYIENLNNDIRLIKELYAKWAVHTSDPKMTTFIYKTAQEFLDKKRNKNQKLIIFTECIATQKELVKTLAQMPIANCKILSITSENRDSMKEVIESNFDANYKGIQKDDYQILITTDVLAEGVNLHRANSIVNYDSPWNATRLMQRLGRINRIGTSADKIWNYNFYPSTLGDKQINLKDRTYMKLQAFHELLGEDSQIYSSEEKVRHFEQPLISQYEDSQTPIMPFIAELRDFKKAHPKRYEELDAIQMPIVSSIKHQEYGAFSNVQEDKNGTSVQSRLYISNKNKETKQVGQLEFFETLKLITTEQQSGKINNRNMDLYRTAVLDCYQAEKQTAALSLKNKSVFAKDKNNALQKIQFLYSKNLPQESRGMLDRIANAVRNSNTSLIKRILKTPLDEHALFDSVEIAIRSWNNLIIEYTEDIKADVSITVLAEE